MLSWIEIVNSAVNNFIWGVPAMICIIGVGLVLSFRTGFLQIRKFPYAMKVTLGRMLKKREASDGALTPFQAVCTALAATVGTGNVAGVAGGGDAKQHIARAADGFNVAGEYILIAKIIAHAGEVADVGDRDGRVTRAVFAITSGQLFRKMHRIAMGTAVTAGQHFTTRLKAIRQQDSGTLDSMDIGFVLQKVSQRFRGFVQFVTNKILVHEDNPSV